MLKLPLWQTKSFVMSVCLQVSRDLNLVPAINKIDARALIWLVVATWNVWRMHAMWRHVRHGLRTLCSLKFEWTQHLSSAQTFDGISKGLKYRLNVKKPIITFLQCVNNVLNARSAKRPTAVVFTQIWVNISFFIRAVARGYSCWWNVTKDCYTRIQNVLAEYCDEWNKRYSREKSSLQL